MAEQCTAAERQEKAVHKEAKAGQAGRPSSKAKSYWKPVPAFPSIFLANVRALDNKIDLLRMRMSVHQDMRNCSRFFIICHIHNHTGYNR